MIPKQSPLDIAINMLLRCEHFLRSLAFQSNDSTAEQAVKHVQRLCNDFHETLFIVDLALSKYRCEQRIKDENAPSSVAGVYRLLSEINEQLTDYAFLVAQRIHPWDVPYRVEGSSSTLTAAKYTDLIKFPPATWQNRILRQTTTPLARFPLENSNSGIQSETDSEI